MLVYGNVLLFILKDVEILYSRRCKLMLISTFMSGSYGCEQKCQMHIAGSELLPWHRRCSDVVPGGGEHLLQQVE